MKGKGEGSKMRQGKLLDKLEICKCERKVGGSKLGEPQTVKNLPATRRPISNQETQVGSVG